METTNNDYEQRQYNRPPSEHQSYPWLVICHGKHKQRQTFFSLSQDRYYTRIIPEMRNKSICTSSYGWLVLEDLDSNDCFLLNLKSMEKIQLPSLESINYGTCVLSSSPNDPNCHILVVDWTEKVFAYCKPGDESFKEGNFDGRLSTLTTSGGKIYGLLTYGFIISLVTIEFEGLALRFTQLTKKGELPKLPSGLMFKEQLIEFSGEFFYICKFYVGSRTEKVAGFRVYKKDSSTRWSRVRSIGTNTIFLSDSHGTFMCNSAVESGVKGNCIYYFEKERNFYVYNLEEETISMHLPCPIAKKDSKLYWILSPTERGS